MMKPMSSNEMEKMKMRSNCFWAAALAIFAAVPAVHAQDMTGLNITSDDFTKAEMSRSDVEAGIAALAPGKVLDLSGKSLNGLDLSAMDLRRVKLQSARINKTNFKGANLEGVVLDQAWALNSDFSGANLKSASLFATQFGGGKLDGADFSNAHVAADFTNASVTKAKFDGADLSADEKNQSMGLMRGAFKSTNLDGSSFKGANMARVMMEFASLRGVDLTNADLRKSELAAADLTDAEVTGANFDGADLNATKIGKMKNAAAARNLDKAKNLGQAVTD
jgi:uncharacterized protein YjbI with pentapeptide repeats